MLEDKKKFILQKQNTSIIDEDIVIVNSTLNQVSTDNVNDNKNETITSIINSTANTECISYTNNNIQQLLNLELTSSSNKLNSKKNEEIQIAVSKLEMDNTTILFDNNELLKQVDTNTKENLSEDIQTKEKI